MNISAPVPSQLEGVDFTFLSADEIHAISAKKIENDTTYTPLMHPTPGGLYDTALGAMNDFPCTTCNLGRLACPGHPGHIDLPVPVYHPVFIDQTYRLLRAQCVYCHGFRLPRKELHRFTCMLRLLQFGLLDEAQEIDSIGQGELERDDQDSDSGTDAEGATFADPTMRKRDSFVRKALQRRLRNISLDMIRRDKHEGALELRRELIKELMASIVKDKTCRSCAGISPVYRKDRSVKIFERELTAKEKTKMAQAGKKKTDVLLATQRRSKQRAELASDEAIADLDLSSEEQGDSGGDGDDTSEELDQNGDVVMADAVTSKTSNSKSHPAPKRDRYLNAKEVLERLNLLFEKEQDLLGLLYRSTPPHKNLKPLTADMFFLQTLLVPPNRYRPDAKMGDRGVSEAQQNNLYKLILRSSSLVAQISRELLRTTKSSNVPDDRRARQMASLQDAWVQLQESVNALIDRNHNPVTGAAAKRNEEGIKQKLEKKEGLFRMNMMGKRVNFAARTVISPDPNIETNEIGVPPVFATKLTFPEPVTSHNFKDLQQAVINGVDKWPGASAIENENGQVINLRSKSQDERIAIANQLLAPSVGNLNSTKNKKVHRHITNGDVVLMNRQPTLHKPGIMGHRVRVLPGEKTLRMHYANCNTYNADFDGDEMNMHFPQSELARSEALQLADTDHQYTSATAGKPLRGLIQDHLSVSVALCSRDTFFDRSAYQQLVYSALRPENGHITRERLELVAPAIIKPVTRWTGKQVITTILKNIRPSDCGDLWMNGKTQVPADRWGAGSEEGQVVFRDGEFVSGILDKAHLGPSSGGLVHAIHEVYGPAIAGKLLSSMGRLLTRYLNMRAFTCGMDDLRMTPLGEKIRNERLKAASSVGLRIAAKYVSLEDQSPTKDDPLLLRRLEEVMRDDSKQENLDLLMNSGSGEVSSDVTKHCLPAGLEKQFPKNHMQSMTISGAKGSGVNANLISCNLGQQVLEGRRVPLMVSGKSLPCFRPFDVDIRAGGYIVQRFLTGIRPQEYYFHHMAGREGLIDTAVKTSRSGYLQRCLTKGMEGLKVAYDGTVRDADGSLVQVLYGEDGLDVSSQKYLTDFGFLLHNLDSQLAQVNYADPATQSLFQHKDDIVKQMKSAIRSAGRHHAATDPVTAYLDPARFAFATSEKFFKKMTEYIKKNQDGLIKEKGTDKTNSLNLIPRKTAEKVLAAKYLRSLVQPGEPVGIVAGQSVGEPSTQMTLNTFHLAGHSAKNVTLGIPRLREILMTASAKILTPTMTLVLNEELSHRDGERFAKSLSVLPLAHVVDRAVVREHVGKGVAYPSAKIYNIRLHFFPSQEYTQTYAISIADVLDTVEKEFMPTLSRLVTKEIQRRRKERGTVPDIGASAGAVEMARPNGGDQDGDEEVDPESDDDGDGDATNAKQKANRDASGNYEANDDDDDAIQRQMDKDATPDQDGHEVDFIDEAYGGSPEPDSSERTDESKEKPARRETRIKTDNKHVSRFRCDEVAGEWCEFTLEFDSSIPKILMLSIVQRAVRQSLVQYIDFIGECTFVTKEKMVDPRTGDETEVPVVHTKGVNLKAMQRYGDYIDPNRIATNDCAAVLRVYGVEACRQNIIRELSGVFSGHGISVDSRHLNLIADYMTRNGGFTPFNRNGLKGNVSPLAKMSFETTLGFLKDAVLDGDWDNLSSPSSRIVLGRLGTVGTGSFDVLTKVPTGRVEAGPVDDEL
ncbi:beta and beta-prime subunits of DNA dependent RNA-polymerase [Thozetella sp. PMI_491]|nr:beta and beta-prime subunits of DNA dependent RNA-polymerase [Thozetella sp. PMI_491]